ncbi:cysteine hydrolase [Rhodoferax sp.]|uniref:cysteine hydrolase n=1 Tax=Rhodoferax sp. TaxID=50421 RepID=UPI00374D8CD8
MRHTHLLIIDPQNDFCDLAPTADTAPALPVVGADADMRRLARFIRRHASQLSDITITLDSHHRLDIAHPTFWQQGEGSAVTPFTTITAADVRAGLFQPRQPAHLARSLAYLDELEARGRYTLMVWPVHCEIGTWGHNVHAEVHAAYNAWEDLSGASVTKLGKGSNPWTEHYSAVMAEVPDTLDGATQLNRPLMDAMDQADVLLIAGEASSHCVRATTEHILAHLARHKPQRIVLLTDCMSPVGGFQLQHEAFLQDMQRQGLELANSQDLRL